MGTALFVGGAVFFWHFAGQAAQAFGWTGKPGRLTLTDCRYQNGGGDGGVIVKDCRGRFVSSDGRTVNPDVELTTGSTGRHDEGDVVPVRYVHGTAIQVSLGNAVLTLIPAFLGALVVAGGITLIVTGLKGSD
ncbi:hypothetical protein [Catenulispora pinisilvae]|uniref:hypothetical protein n=1 Tax=Catenulispora pinisilvae TaxID=2705253 RepID=UPI0018927383|nr:hypothetical protein [Catenulispora pinisilvae]